VTVSSCQTSRTDRKVAGSRQPLARLDTAAARRQVPLHLHEVQLRRIRLPRRGASPRVRGNQRGCYQDIKLEVGAIADALDQQEPTIAMVNSGTHWVITKGGHWDKTPYDQPNANYLTINDPDMGATIHYMMNDWGNKVGSAKITVAGDHDYNA
jgi:hypothetical protein